jgi:hypothetical protein
VVTLSGQSVEDKTTPPRHLPGLDIWIIRRGSRNDQAEQISISLRAVPRRSRSATLT